MWNFLNNIVSSLGSLASFVGNFFANFFNSIWQALTDLWNNFLAPAFEVIGNAIASVVSGIANVCSAIGSAFEYFWTTFLAPAFQAIGDAFVWICNSIGDFFVGLWNSIADFFAGIPDFFANFWNAFTSFLIGIFVPEEGYYDNVFNDLKGELAQHIDTSTYQEAFSNLQEINEGETAGLDVNFKNYQIGDRFLSTPKKWVDFDFVLQYKNKWFAWCRAFTWIFFIIYNINQALKVLWGRTATDGSTIVSSNNSSGGDK